MVGEAVNVTFVPAHILVALAAICTAGVTLGFTTMFNVFEVAVSGLAHAALLVNTTLTVWPLVKVEVVKLGLLVPWLLPFTFHW